MAKRKLKSILNEDCDNGQEEVLEQALEQEEKSKKEMDKVMKDRSKDATIKTPKAPKTNNMGLVESILKDTSYILNEDVYSVDVVDRKALGRLITTLKENNVKFSISRSLKEGFRYTLSVNKVLNESTSDEVEDELEDEVDIESDDIEVEEEDTQELPDELFVSWEDLKDKVDFDVDDYTEDGHKVDDRDSGEVFSDDLNSALWEYLRERFNKELEGVEELEGVDIDWDYNDEGVEVTHIDWDKSSGDEDEEGNEQTTSTNSKSASDYVEAFKLAQMMTVAGTEVTRMSPNKYHYINDEDDEGYFEERDDGKLYFTKPDGEEFESYPDANNWWITHHSDNPNGVLNDYIAEYYGLPSGSVFISLDDLGLDEEDLRGETADPDWDELYSAINEYMTDTYGYVMYDYFVDYTEGEGVSVYGIEWDIDLEEIEIPDDADYTDEVVEDSPAQNAYKLYKDGQLSYEQYKDVCEVEGVEPKNESRQTKEKKMSIKEGSTAFKNAVRKGGEKTNDYLDGQAIARVKDPNERARLVATKKLEKSGKLGDRTPVSKEIKGKEAQVGYDYEKKAQNYSIKKDIKECGDKPIDEDLKLLADMSDYKPWSGAVDFYNEIRDEGKLDDLEFILEDIYPDGLTITQLNDLLWFEEDWVREMLGMNDYVADDDTDDIDDRFMR